VQCPPCPAAGAPPPPVIRNQAAHGRAGDFPRPGDERTEPAKNRLVALKVAVLLERLHRALQLRPPRPDHPVLGLDCPRIRRRSVLGGLISEYERVA
jgi:hypothetical protein